MLTTGLLKYVRHPGLNCVFRRLPKPNVFVAPRRTYSESPDEGPIRYSTSKAAKWRASYSRSGMDHEDDSPWFESWIVCGSLAVFMVYFCVLREENDIDEILSGSLYDRIEGLEKTQLKLTLDYNKDHGIDNTAVRERLAEIEEVEEKNKSLPV